MTRFTLENWKRFRTHDKKTTIRMKPLKPGPHKCVGGPRYKPIRLGTIEAYRVKDSKAVRNLTPDDAVNDGFDNLAELFIELAHRNPSITADMIIHIQSVTVIEDLSEAAGS